MVADPAERSKLSVYRTEARQAVPSSGRRRAGAKAGACRQPSHAWRQARANSFSRWGHAAVLGHAVAGAGRDCGGGRVKRQGEQTVSELQAPRVSVLERARRYAQKCAPAVSGQGGHRVTFRLACALVHGFALSEQDALNVLREWNLGCQPEWSEAELIHKAKSAAAAPSQREWGYLIGPRGIRQNRVRVFRAV